MLARISRNESAIAITQKVVEATGIDGNFCCDFILRDDGSAVLLEVNPRLTGTLPFIAEAGMNLPYMRVVQLLGKDVSGDENIHVNYDLRMNKRYESEYLFNIYCMYYQRPDKILTKHLFEYCTYVVRKKEVDEYCHAGIDDMLVIPEGEA